MNKNDYLMHYGVKGMKWGVRKDPRYESFRTRKLRSHIEGYDEDIKDPTFNKRAHNMLVKDRAKLYAKYNKSKDKDYKRKQLANRHPSQLRNFGSYTARSFGVGLGIGAAAAGAFVAANLIRSAKGDFSLASALKDEKRIALGTSVVSTYAAFKLAGEHIERARAINEVQKNGRFKEVRR